MNLQAATRISAAVLVLVNLGIAGFVAMGETEVKDILLLFWAESAVILLFSILTVARTAKGRAVLLVPFFMLHAGIFMSVHLLFLTRFVTGDVFAFPDPIGAIIEVVARHGMLLGGLALSHAVSWLLHLRESNTNPMDAMGGFYVRIIAMQFAIIFGGMAIMAFGSPVWAVVILVVMKTLLDVAAHFRKHKPPADGTKTAGASPRVAASPGQDVAPNDLEGSWLTPRRGPGSKGTTRPRLRR